MKFKMIGVGWGIVFLCAIGSAQEPNLWYSVVDPQPDFEYIMPDPSISGRLYGFNRGFFISTDDGKRWVASNIGILPEYIRGMSDYGEDAFFRVDTGQPDLYYIFNLYHPDRGGNSGYNTRHLHKSTDSGATWNELWQLYYIHSTVEMDPISGTMIAGMNEDARLAIQKSTDEGWSWLPTMQFGTNFMVTCIEFAPQGNGIVYAGLYCPVGTIFKSTDLGDSWINVQPSSGWNSILMYQIEIHPVDSDIVIAVIESTDPIRRTLNGGVDWTSITPPDLLNTNIPCSVFIAPDPPYPIFVYADGCRSIQRSEDLGNSWQTVTWDLRDSSAYEDSLLHCSPFACSPQVPGHYYFAHGPIHSTTDGGISWSLQTESNGTDTRFGMVLSSGNPNNLINLIGTNGAMWSSNSGANWLPSDGIDDFMFGAPLNTVINPIQPDSIWNFTYKPFECSDRFTSLVRASIDGGASWQTSNAFEDVRVVWMRASLHSPSRMFALVDTRFDINSMGDTFIRTSDDEFQTFREIHIDQTDCLWDITDLPDSPDSLIVLGSTLADPQCRGIVCRSIDAGESWSESGTDVGFDAPRVFEYSPQTADVGFVQIDPSNPNRFYVGFGSLFVSEDSGTTFARFPVEQYSIDDGKGAFQIDPSDPDVLYCALKNEPQDSNVIRSCDRGGIWSDPLYPRYLQISLDGTSLIDQSGRRRMDIDSGPPNLLMAGYFPSESGTIAAFLATDPDLNDSVTGIHAYFESERLPVYVQTEIEPGSGLFYFNLGVVAGTPGQYRIEFQAKDRFGILSAPWPQLVVSDVAR